MIELKRSPRSIGSTLCAACKLKAFGFKYPCLMKGDKTPFYLRIVCEISRSSLLIYESIGQDAFEAIAAKYVRNMRYFWPVYAAFKRFNVEETCTAVHSDPVRVFEPDSFSAVAILRSESPCCCSAVIVGRIFSAKAKA